jgi:hypothetical protein
MVDPEGFFVLKVGGRALSTFLKDKMSFNLRTRI